jgi:FkbM family methyltransferase
LHPLDRGDVQSFIEVFVYRCYPPATEGTLLDAGAHIGLFSVFSAAMGPVERIFAVEPDPRNLDLLAVNLGELPVAVSIISGALWNAEGRAPFYRSRVSNLGRVVKRDEGFTDTDEQLHWVDAFTPHSGALPRPEEIDYLKMDIEGAERVVLPYYVREMSPGSVIACELHGAATIEQFGSVLGTEWEVIEEGPSRLVFVWRK